MNLSNRIKILFSLLLILFISIPITLSLIQKQQNQRSNASAGTTLSLIPEPGPSSDIQKTVGDNVPIDIKVDPGSNLVTILRLQAQYDPTKLQADTSNPFTPTTKFSVTLQPVINNGTVSLIIATGGSPSDAIQSPTTAGTFHFKAIGSTSGSPTVVSFTSQTQAYSAGSTDTARDNVLSSTSPANITISDVVLPSATPTLTPTMTPPSSNTQLSFTILLHGIGAAGDTPNPTGNSLSNKNPKHPERQLTASVYDSHDQLVTNGTGTITYVTTSDNQDDIGTFKGSVILGAVLANGKYTVKVKTDGYLRKAFPGTISIVGNQVNILPPIALVAGDTDEDNSLNILDYNALLDCGYGSLNPLPVTNLSSEYNSATCKTHEPRVNIDLDDNGFVNAYDYNLFIRELSVQGGD